MIRFSMLVFITLQCFINAKTPPNIIVIMNDQHHGGVLGSLGVKGLKTPKLDALRKQGIYFNNAYCTQPICVPSRTSMMTGRMPHQVGAEINRDSLPKDISGAILGELMTNAGYDTAYMGKTHLVGGAGRGFNTYYHTKERAVDHLLGDTAIEFMKKKRKKPFFAIVSFRNPHDICQWARGDKLPDGDIAAAPEHLHELPQLPHNFQVAEDEPDCIRYVKSLHWRTYPSKGWEEKKWRQYVWAYHRLIEKVDTEIGKVTDFIKTSEYAKNTVIIFFSDHGDGCACHQWNQKSVLYEESACVPLIISDPFSSKKNLIDNKSLISTGLDLMPTLCDYAGIKKPKGLLGMSLKPLLYGKALNRDHVVCETEFANYDVTYNIKGRMIRTKRYKYVAYDVGNKKEQFFDLKNDPGEMKNLILDKNLSKEIQDHRALLQKWCEKTKDSFVLPEPTKAH